MRQYLGNLCLIASCTVIIGAVPCFFVYVALALAPQSESWLREADLDKRRALAMEDRRLASLAGKQVVKVEKVSDNDLVIEFADGTSFKVHSHAYHGAGSSLRYAVEK
jgi:hypothetical protein